MNLNRRGFMLLGGSLTAAFVMPLQAAVLGRFCTQDMLLATGLPTDAAFAKGTNADVYKAKLTDTSSYAKLIKRLALTEGQRLFALIQPGDALLLEQALRDSNRRCYISRFVNPPTPTACNSWALEIGRRLSKGLEVASSHSHAGTPLVAITAYL